MTEQELVRTLSDLQKYIEKNGVRSPQVKAYLVQKLGGRLHLSQGVFSETHDHYDWALDIAVEKGYRDVVRVISENHLSSSVSSYLA